MLVLAGCLHASYGEREGYLWHPDGVVAMPDLSLEGWERVSVSDAEIAFQRNGTGVIAVRVRCPTPDADIPLRWEGRQLWLGVPRGHIRRFHLDVDGYEAVRMEAESDGLHLRTLVVRTEDCSVDVVQAAPSGRSGELAFEDFVARLRLAGNGR